MAGSIRRWAITVGCGLLVASLPAAAAAQSPPQASGPPHWVVTRVWHAGQLKGLATPAGLAAVPAAAGLTLVHDKDFAGYDATPAHGVTKFAGSFTVPKVTCPATGSPSIFTSVNLSGPQGIVFFQWVASCFKGQASYQGEDAFFCLSTTPTGQVCQPEAQVDGLPGDSLTFSMSENATAATTTLTASDVTRKETATATAHVLLSLPAIEAGTSFCCTNSVGNVTPIPSFTPVTFGGLKFNGASLSGFSPAEYEMYDGTVLQVATSSISSAGSFTNTFKHV